MGWALPCGGRRISPGSGQGNWRFGRGRRGISPGGGQWTGRFGRNREGIVLSFLARTSLAIVLLLLGNGDRCVRAVDTNRLLVRGRSGGHAGARLVEDIEVAAPRRHLGGGDAEEETLWRRVTGWEAEDKALTLAVGLTRLEAQCSSIA